MSVTPQCDPQPSVWHRPATRNRLFSFSAVASSYWDNCLQQVKVGELGSFVTIKMSAVRWLTLVAPGILLPVRRSTSWVISVGCGSSLDFPHCGRCRRLTGASEADPDSVHRAAARKALFFLPFLLAISEGFRERTRCGRRTLVWEQSLPPCSPQPRVASARVVWNLGAKPAGGAPQQAEPVGFAVVGAVIAPLR